MLSPSRQKSLVDGLTSIARKVFEAVPISEAWTISQIQAELSRTSAAGRDFRNVQGCLRYLTEVGLISQPEKDTTFRRVPVREVSVNEVEEPMSKPTITVPAAQPKPATRSPITILSGLATQMRSLADEIDHAALEIEESISSNQAEIAHLQQLKTILRNIGLGT